MPAARVRHRAADRSGFRAVTGSRHRTARAYPEHHDSQLCQGWLHGRDQRSVMSVVREGHGGICNSTGPDLETSMYRNGHVASHLITGEGLPEALGARFRTASPLCLDDETLTSSCGNDVVAMLMSERKALNAPAIRLEVLHHGLDDVVFKQESLLNVCHTDMLPEHMTPRGHARDASSRPQPGGDCEAVHRWAPRGARPSVRRGRTPSVRRERAPSAANEGVTVVLVTTWWLADRQQQQRRPPRQ